MAEVQAQPIELYYWPTPNGWKITIMLEELGLPYVVKLVNIGKGDQFNPDFLALSPNNKMPVIVDPDGPDGRPISIFESGAILQYLGRKTGRFYPTDERGRVEVDQWLFWQVSGLGPMAGQAHHFRIYAPEKLPYAIERYTNEMHRLYGVMNTRLKDRDYLAGDYSFADIGFYMAQTFGERMGAPVPAGMKRLLAWRDRLSQRTPVQRVMRAMAGYLRAQGRTLPPFMAALGDFAP